MKKSRLTLYAAFALGLSLVAPLESTALPLSYDSATRLVMFAQVRGSPGSGIAPIQEGYLDVGGASATGSMELTPEAGGEFDLTYSFSMFDDGSPLVLTGSYGNPAIPVTLRIDEISYQSSPERVTVGRVQLNGTVTGLLRGTLTVGTTTTPLSISTNGSGFTDAMGCLCLVGIVDPAESSLGYEDGFGGVGLYSLLGPFVAEVTVDGTNFTVDATPAFQRLFYVPEPAAGALLALSVGAVMARRARRSHLSSKPS